MKRFITCHFVIITALLCLTSSLLRAQQLQPRHVAVVYNAQSEHSRECAKLYAMKRAIPERNLLPLSIPVRNRDITTQDYVKDIHDPLMKLASQRQLMFPASRQMGIHPIYAMVLMPDLPLRIKARPVVAGEKTPEWKDTTAASVDSELALIGSGDYTIDGMQPNPYFGRDEDIALSGFRMLPVCRIDSPDPSIDKRMINNAIAVEREGGLAGWVIVDQGGPYPDGDKWLQAIATRAIELRQPTFVDVLRPSIVEYYPLPQPAAVYFGWYEGKANGPFVSHTASARGGVQTFRFRSGAIAVHLHSFSATNVRSRDEGWVGALLARGADVSAGNVWEPFLHGSLHLDIFYKRLLSGFTLAEASAMATPVLSWQGIVIGDPLYRPYPTAPKAATLNIGMQACVEFVEKKYDSAALKFATIVKNSKDPDEQIRAALCVVQCQLLAGKKDEAKVSLDRILTLFPENIHKRAAERMMKQHFPSAQ